MRNEFENPALSDSGLSAPLPLLGARALEAAFERIGDRYVVSRDYERLLLRSLQGRMRPAYPDPATRFTLVQSLYFDSTGLDVYASHFQPGTPRFKLRVLQYAPNGTWDLRLAMLELKTRVSGVVRKGRLALDDANFVNLLRGVPLELSGALQLRNARTNYKRLAGLVPEINGLIRRYDLRPRLSVICTRRAFEAEGLRISLDTGIRSQLIEAIGMDEARSLAGASFWAEAREMRERLPGDGRILLEVKRPVGETPAWVESLLTSIRAERGAFSKYCYGITRAIAAQAGSA